MRCREKKRGSRCDDLGRGLQRLGECVPPLAVRSPWTKRGQETRPGDGRVEGLLGEERQGWNETLTVRSGWTYPQQAGTSEMKTSAQRSSAPRTAGGLRQKLDAGERESVQFCVRRKSAGSPLEHLCHVSDMVLSPRASFGGYALASVSASASTRLCFFSVCAQRVC